ncbi:MAG: hypothetical protein WC359_14335 [Dehalococcoidia bacterium]|jgi:hypothetical protein
MRKLIHGFIVWYLRKVSGAFHHFPYGIDGVYVVIMCEEYYHHFNNMGALYTELDWWKTSVKQLQRENDRLAAENAYLRRPQDGCTCPKTSIGFVQVASHDCPVHGNND